MDDQLRSTLERSRDLGFLGPGDVGVQIAHARAFVDAWDQFSATPPASLLDLGSGGGVPGLVLAASWRSSRVVLLDAGVRRCAFLREAVAELGLEDRVTVEEGRAEVLARSAPLESSVDLVVSRSFGPPAAVAECAVRYLRAQGVLLVAEPPDEAATIARWPEAGLATLGLGPAILTRAPRRIVRISRIGDLPDRFPRREGTPTKTPLF